MSAAVASLLAALTAVASSLVFKIPNAATNSTTITIDKPSGVVAGDVLLFSVVQNETDNDNGGLDSPTLSGWTLVRDREIRSEGTNNKQRKRNRTI